MKKSLLILAAATAVGFAACNGGNTEGTLTPAQADSIKQATAQATADSILNAQKLQGDSIANAQNALAVDSLKRINDSLAIVAAKPTPTPSKGTPTKKPTKKPSNGNGGVKDEPPVVAPVDKGSNTYRPGAKNSNNGSGTESSAPKSNSDRPGAK